MTASRMRDCACDTAAWLCVRTVLCSSAFSLAPPLRSTSSAAAEATSFARFSATLGKSDFSLALIVGYGLRPSRRGPDHDWWGLRWRSPGSQVEGFCACQGLRRRGAGSYLAITTRIARAAAEARWGGRPIRALHKGSFKEEFGVDVDCYVLDDPQKTAVISQRGMGEALGLSSRGNAFPRFLAQQSIADVAGAELRAKLENPLKFQ